MVLEEFYKLNNGQRIPKIALGTWQTPNDVAAQVVETAIDAGIAILIPPLLTKMNLVWAWGSKMPSKKRESIAKASSLPRKSRPKSKAVTQRFAVFRNQWSVWTAITWT